MPRVSQSEKTRQSGIEGSRCVSGVELTKEIGRYTTVPVHAVPTPSVSTRIPGGLEPCEQGHEPEQLSLAQHVGHQLTVDGLDRAGANDVEEPARLSRAVLDHRPDGEELDVGVANDLGEALVIELVERRVHPQERRNVHAGEYRTA